MALKSPWSMTWNISRWEKLSLAKSSKSLERPHCCSTCKKFLRWASALWASIQSGKELSLSCVVSLLVLSMFFYFSLSTFTFEYFFSGNVVLLWFLKAGSRTHHWSSCQHVLEPTWHCRWLLIPEHCWTTNYVAERFPEFLALVFEPEFMNSAGKEVLMDMAEQRHLLPVYRSDKL